MMFDLLVLIAADDGTNTEISPLGDIINCNEAGTPTPYPGRSAFGGGADIGR